MLWCEELVKTLMTLYLFFSWGRKEERSVISMFFHKDIYGKTDNKNSKNHAG